jgi:hypothetical protein
MTVDSKIVADGMTYAEIGKAAEIDGATCWGRRWYTAESFVPLLRCNVNSVQRYCSKMAKLGVMEQKDTKGVRVYRLNRAHPSYPWYMGIARPENNHAFDDLIANSCKVCHN